MAKKQTKKSIRPTDLISGAQRLNRVLAASGLGSRRDVEQLIVEGRVEVDGKTVTDLACKVDPKESSIEVDGVSLKKHRPVYFALNKPSGVLSTNYDPSGRMRVVDLVPTKDRIFPVGRLDRSSEGLMLLTNDGELAQRLAHPKYGIQKAYFVVVQGVITHEDLAKLRKGVYLADGVARIDGAKIRRQRKTCTEIEILLSEGKNREIRRILARVGHKVVVLRRLAIGPLKLGQLPVGQTRIVTNAEVEALYAATSSTTSQRKSESKGVDLKEGLKTRKPTKATGSRSTASRSSTSRATGKGRVAVGRQLSARGSAAASGRAPRTPQREQTNYGAMGLAGSQRTGSVLSYDGPPASVPPVKAGGKVKPQAKKTGKTGTSSSQRGSSASRGIRSAKPKTSTGKTPGGKSTGKPRGRAGGER